MGILLTFWQTLSVRHSQNSFFIRFWTSCILAGFCIPLKLSEQQQASGGSTEQGAGGEN